MRTTAKNGHEDYDVAVVGAGIAGCTAAVLFARRGLRVALLERESDPDHYKKACTHAIQPGATPTLERLGLAEKIEAAGGNRGEGQVWTRWGWIRADPSDGYRHVPYGYNIRREKLDPMMRQLAAETPGVDFLPGHSVRDVTSDNGRFIGVQAWSKDGGMRPVTARLIVAADGRSSRVAELCGIATKKEPHGRFAYFAYFRDLDIGADFRMWLLDPDVAYMFPTDDGLTLVAVMRRKDQLRGFKADIEGSFYHMVESLPDAPDIRSAEKVSDFMGMLDYPNLSRWPTAPGVALVGDAAVSVDYLWGVGCGWAFQSAEWLVDNTADALLSGGERELDEGLKRYRKEHSRRLAGHQRLITDYATGRKMNAIERLMFSAGAKDPVMARHTNAFGSRQIGVLQFLSPPAVARAVWVNIRPRRRDAISSGGKESPGPEQQVIEG